MVRDTPWFMVAVVGLSLSAAACGGNEPSAPDPEPQAELRLVGSVPGEVVSGRTLPTIEIEVVPAAGSEGPAPTVEVEILVSKGSGTLTGTTRLGAVDGRVAFSDLVLTGVGTHTLTVRAEGLSSLPLPSLTFRLPTDPVAVTGARVLTMDGRGVLHGHTVVAEDGRITALGVDGSVELPADALVIEADGGWVMPGLIDSHVHPRGSPAWPADWNRTSALYLANGITSIVTMGDLTDAMPEVAQGVRTGELRAPYVYVGHFARGPSDGGPTGMVASSPDEGRALVTSAVQKGYDFVKVYHGLDAEVFAAIVQEAAGRRIPVLGHIVASVGWEGGASQGHRMPVHATVLLARAVGLQPDAEAIRGLAGEVSARRLPVGSTLFAGEITNAWSLAVLEGRDPWDIVLAQPGIEFLSPTALVVWESMLRARPEVTNPVDRSGVVAASRAFAKELVDAGTPLLIGSDDVGIPGIVPGFGFHREIEQVAATGIDAWDILRGATLWPGEFIRDVMRPDEFVGTLRVGARADLLLLEGDPRADLGTLEEARGVLANGVWYDGADLRAELAALSGN